MKTIGTIFCTWSYWARGITLVVLLLVFAYSLNVWFGVCISAILLMGVGGIILNILEDNERGY